MGRLRRRSSPIHAYLGTGNGSGKSFLMVYDTLPSLEFGRPVLSTVRLLDYKNPRPCEDPTCTFPGHPKHQAAHPLWIPFKDYQQLLDAQDCDILMDEVTGVASSREYQSMPVQVANFLVQLRRRNCTLRWSSTNWARADVIIREVTQAATLVTPHMPLKRPTVPGEPPSLWSDKRLFIARTYDAALLDDFDARGADASPQHNIWQAVWRPGGYAERAYDTIDPVLSLGWANQAGMCMVCGGKRTVPKCACGHSHATEPGRRVRALPEASAVPSAGAERNEDDKGNQRDYAGDRLNGWNSDSSGHVLPVGHECSGDHQH